jgi:hypothetical protein
VDYPLWPTLKARKADEPDGEMLENRCPKKGMSSPLALNVHLLCQIQVVVCDAANAFV